MDQQNNPLESLSKRIKDTAYNVANRYGADVEDVEQDLILILLEQYLEDPDFLNDSQAALNFAANRVGWQHRKEMIHAGRIGLEDIEVEDGTMMIDTFYSTNPWAAVEQSLVVEQMMSELDERDQMICEGLTCGYTPREIGPEIGCSYRTVYNRIDALAEVFAA